MVLQGKRLKQLCGKCLSYVLHSNHVPFLTPEQHPATVRAITTFKKTHSSRFLILSNSNSAYIDIILKEQGLENFFEDVITNPAQFLPNGCLEVKRRVLADAPKQHGCKVGCSPNMCKGGFRRASKLQHQLAQNICECSQEKN